MVLIRRFQILRVDNQMLYSDCYYDIMICDYDCDKFRL